MFHYMSSVIASTARTVPRPRGPKRCNMSMFFQCVCGYPFFYDNKTTSNTTRTINKHVHNV